MTKRENRCADCGAKFGLVVHRHGRLKFCRKETTLSPSSSATGTG